jgi:hypothetical protein
MVTPPSWRQHLSAAARRCLAILLPLLLSLALPLFGCNRGPREVRIDVSIASGQLDKRELYVPVNTRVAITLRNRDSGPAATARSFVLVEPGAGPTPKPTEILAQSPVIAPGQIATFRFAAPSSGNYEFFCSAVAAKPLPSGGSPTVLRGKFVVQ